MDNKVFESKFTPEEYLDVKHTLRFHADGKFRVLFFGDPHGGYGRHPQIKPAMETVIKATNPDLVLFTGDLCGCHIGAHNEAELREYLDDVMEYLEVHHIPWAHVYGNHDYNLGVSNAEQQTIYESYSYCVSKRGPEDIDGVSNYVLPVLAHDSDTPMVNIWALDSHDDNRQFLEEYGLPADTQINMRYHMGNCGRSGNARFNQIEWYMNTSKAIENHYGKKVPGILYQHIPIPEYTIIPMNPLACQMEGSIHESVASNELNFGLFASCLQRDDVKGIFCGHDHINDFTGVYCDIRLSYCGGINYDCGCRDDIRGGRVVDFDESDPANFKTYMVKLQSLIGDAGNRREREEFGLLPEKAYK